MKQILKISTEIGGASSIVGEEKAVELVAKAGFDAWDFSMCTMCKYDWGKKMLLDNDHPLAGNNYLKFAAKLKQIGLDNGIVCNQSHAPFPTSAPEIRSYLKRAIECTAEAGGKICIIHPDNNKTAQENAEMYLELLPFATDCGVKIATENMWNWDDAKGHSVFAACATPESFCEHIDIIGNDMFVACLDIGHAEMLGSDTNAPEMIQKLGSRLQALHIHDNDKLNDSHQIPFSMNIDFYAVARALKKIGYNGYLTLEANRYLNKFNADNVAEGIADLAAAVRKIGEIYAED